MKKPWLIILAIASALLLAYLSLWYVLSSNIVESVKSINKSSVDDNPFRRKFVVEGVSVCGFPFKFGAKISSLREEKADAVVNNKGSVYLGYDLWNQRFYLSYDGISSFASTPLNSPGMKDAYVECKSDVYAKAKISLAMLKVLSEESKIFELINFIKGIDNFSAIKIYASDDKSLLLEQTINTTTNIENNNYYRNIDEIMADDTCHKYYVKSDITIGKADTNGYNIPGSILYNMLPKTGFNNVELDCIVSVSFKNLWNDCEFTVNKLKYDSESYSGENSAYVKWQMNQKNLSIDLKLQDETKVKDNFFDYINKALFVDAMSALLNSGVPSVAASSFNDISKNPAKYYFPKNDLKTINTKIDLSFNLKDDNITVDIKQFDIFFDGAGFRIADKVVMDSKFAFATNGLLSIRDSENILKYWSDYLKQIFPENDDYNDERMALINKSLLGFLRAISNHPESNSNEMFFDFSGDSVTQNITIGTKKYDDLLAIYKQNLYINSLSLAQNDPDFMSKAPKLIPELLADKDLMQNLQNASSKATQVVTPTAVPEDNSIPQNANIKPNSSNAGAK